MFHDFIIRPGDLVRCVDASRPPAGPLTVRCRAKLVEGAIYRVTEIVWLHGEMGVHLEGQDHRPTDGFRSCRFRKVMSGEEYLTVSLSSSSPSASRDIVAEDTNEAWKHEICRQIRLCEVATSGVAGPYAVIIEVGHSDTGAYSNGTRVISNLSLEAAQGWLSAGRPSVVRSLLRSLDIIRRGAADGYLIDDGSAEYAIAQIVAEGPDDSIVAVEGFYVRCSAFEDHTVETVEWDDESWSDYMEGSYGSENELEKWLPGPDSNRRPSD